ncbi:MAG TPA: AraC family transcriptional regulator [Victivallis vadensis]|nr:AraC family transcriptional regulator [Victivallis vadensis]
MTNSEITVEVEGGSWFLEIEPNRLHHSRYPQSHRFDTHRHPAYHLILIDRGGCTLHIPDLAPVECPVRSLLLLNPLVPHRFSFEAKECEHNSCIWRFRNRDGRYLEKPLQQLDGRCEKQPAPYLLQVLSPVQASAYLRMHREAETYLHANSGFVTSLKCFRLWTLGLELLMEQSWRQEVVSLESGDFLIERIYRLIEDNFCYSWLNVSYLAEELGKNGNYLNTVFSAKEGIGIGQAIRNRRLEQAKVMLESTSWRIREISEQCGFTRQNYFTQAFRRSTGLTPLEYRRRTGARPEAAR